MAPGSNPGEGLVLFGLLYMHLLALLLLLRASVLCDTAMSMFKVVEVDVLHDFGSG